MKKHLRMSSAAVVIGALMVKIARNLFIVRCVALNHDYTLIFTYISFAEDGKLSEEEFAVAPFDFGGMRSF